MRRYLLELLFVMLLLPASAISSDWQFGIDGGMAVPTQNYFPTESGDGDLRAVLHAPLQFDYFHALEASEGWMVSIYATHTLLVPWFHVGVLGSYDTTGTSANAPVDPSEYVSGAVKTNLGMVETWAIMPYVRIDPWTFGNWTPFFGAGFGYGWNQWNTQGDIPGPFSSSISQTFVTRLELGTDYRMSDHFSLEGMMGGQINDPLVLVALPNGQGGMAESFNMTLFFVEVGVQFSL